MRVEDVIKLNKFSHKRINLYSMDRIKEIVKEEVCREILTIYGIPRSLSPYIVFLEEEKGGFDSVSNFMKRYAIEGDKFSEKKLFKETYIFGFYDNYYLALNSMGQVICLDYESMNTLYVNKDFKTFLSIVIKFNIMKEEYYESNPSGHFFEEELPDVVEDFMDFIESIDEKAIYNDTFWDMLMEECQDF